MKFAVKTVTCLGCRTPLKSGKGKSVHMVWARSHLAESAVCVNCRAKLPELYQKQVSSLSPIVRVELMIRWSRLRHSRLISHDFGPSARDARDHYIRMSFVLRRIVRFSTEGRRGRRRLLLLLLSLIDLKRRLRGDESVQLAPRKERIL